MVNRKDEAVSLSAEGYAITDCTEIHTGAYSFDCNDYTVDTACEPIVHGHSVLFAKLTPKA